MAKKNSNFKPHMKRPRNMLNILIGSERLQKNDGGTFPVILMTHEDVARLWEYSKLMRAKGYGWVLVQKFRKKTKGNIKYTLSLAVPDKREIIHGSTFDKLTADFDYSRDVNELEELTLGEMNKPTKGFKLIFKKGEKEYEDFKEEKPRKPRKKKAEPVEMHTFDALLAESIASEQVEPDEAPVQEPQQPEPDFDQDKDEDYE